MFSKQLFHKTKRSTATIQRNFSNNPTFQIMGVTNANTNLDKDGKEVNHSKLNSALDSTDKSGAYVRHASVYGNWIKADGSTEFKPEANRYHLYVSYACPWANRTLILRNLKGLQDVISVSVVAPVFEATKPEVDEHMGWWFKHSDSPFEEGSDEDTINGAKTIRELYEMFPPPNGGKTGVFSVPILFDKKLKTIVNNESSEIIQMFNQEFNAFSATPEQAALDLAPEELTTGMVEIDSLVYPNINNGVYRCGFAQSQGAYNEAASALFKALDETEELLSKQRYVLGSKLTLSDIRFFVTLVRFDEVYHGHFKCNVKRIADYPNLENYTRDIYQLAGIRETINMRHIKDHYHKSHKMINKFAIVPVGPGVDYSLPHNRNRFE